ncbi:hypothetical protein E2C01_057150 [Portunus trituberculatus]|uniref:Uncharacterized protein n=1 Tax=Portunus trituberculatus TaxID=210409 RepID=A0A5B7H1J7_PORTR|nr:hypothetical protein [Portunus trituberculatus]
MKHKTSEACKVFTDAGVDTFLCHSPLNLTRPFRIPLFPPPPLYGFVYTPPPPTPPPPPLSFRFSHSPKEFF